MSIKKSARPGEHARWVFATVGAPELTPRYGQQDQPHAKFYLVVKQPNGKDALCPYRSPTYHEFTRAEVAAIEKIAVSAIQPEHKPSERPPVDYALACQFKDVIGLAVAAFAKADQDAAAKQASVITVEAVPAPVSNIRAFEPHVAQPQPQPEFARHIA